MYIIFYIILGLLMPFALSLNIKRNINFLGFKWNFPIIMAISIVTLTRAFAYDTGSDYLAYYNHYLSCSNNTFDMWGSQREIGYQYLVKFLSWLSPNPQLFFGVCAFMYMYSLLMIGDLFKKANKYIFLYWPIFMFILSYNLYRQYLAISFILLGLTFFLKHKYYKTSLFLILAVLFHTSSVIGIGIISLIWLYRDYNINKYFIYVCLFITSLFNNEIMILISKAADLFSIFYYTYTGKIYDSASITESMYATSSIIYLNTIAYSILIYYGNKLCKKLPLPQIKLIYYLFVLALILEPITRQEILMRIWLYVEIFVPIYLGILVYYTSKNNIILNSVILFKFLYYIYLLNELSIDHPLILKL